MISPGPVARAAVIAILGGIAFGVLAWFSIELTRAEGRVAAVWIPNAIAVGVLLRVRVPNEKLLLAAMWAGNSIANTIGGDDPVTALGLAICNTIEIALALYIVRRWCGRQPDMLDVGQMSRFLIAAAVLAPMVAASFAFMVLEIAGPTLFESWLRWTVADGLGMTIIAPCVMIGIDSWRNRRPPTRREAMEWALLTFFGTGLTLVIFVQSSYPFLFLAAPIVVSHAFRLGGLGTAFSVIKIAVISSIFTSLGTGPVNLTEGTLSSKLMVLQCFLASAFVIGLPVAATLAKRDRMTRELEKGKGELDLLANNITDAVLRYSTDGKCIYASPSVEEVLGAPAEEFLGKSPTDRMHQDARETIQQATARLLSGETLKERLNYRRYLDAEDGSPVYIEADCAVALNSETGEPEAIVVSARDVTSRVELEQLLLRARHEAEEATHAKSEFLANMSHEIRTPMNGVLGFAELMLQSDLSSDQRRQAQMIVESGRSMMMLLNDVLDLSKIEAGQITIESEPVDLETMLHDCMTLYRSNADSKGLELRLECDDWDHAVAGRDTRPQGDERHWVMTDGLRLRQIILNLVGNAIKFTKQGFVIVSYRVTEDRVTVRVMDTGIGISDDRMGSIFEPFTQAESDTARRFGGTGLGLTICRQLAELLGGYIEADSQLGVGSCFTLVLPAPAAKPAVVNDVEPLPVDLEALPERARILLAEDHDVNRMLITEMLEKCGQSVAIAHDGNEAIAMVMDSIVRDKPYDLVLMDVQMPGCDGYAATRAIRAEGIEADQLPIIALTANAFPEDIKAAHQAGMQAHLSKPLEFARLARALQRWLPTTIVDASEPAASSGTERPAKAPEEAEAGSIPHSSDLMARWEHRRAEALEAIGFALDKRMTGKREWPPAEREELAQCAHKLAGSAAMFGEAALGEKAAELDYALRTNPDNEGPARLAAELLAIAGEAEAESENLRATG